MLRWIAFVSTELPKSSLNVLKILQNVVLQGRKLKRSVYVFSCDVEGTKVAHVNFVADDAKSKGLDARLWASHVSDILGGKVWFLVHCVDVAATDQYTVQAGGKEDGAQGVGVNVSRVSDAVEAAKAYFTEKTGL